VVVAAEPHKTIFLEILELPNMVGLVVVEEVTTFKQQGRVERVYLGLLVVVGVLS